MDKDRLPDPIGLGQAEVAGKDWCLQHFGYSQCGHLMGKEYSSVGEWLCEVAKLLQLCSMITKRDCIIYF